MSSVPSLSKEDLELRAEKVLLRANRLHFRLPQETSVIGIAEKIQKRGLVQVSVAHSLGVDANDRKIFGLCSFQPPMILVDSSLPPNGTKFRFVLAHELGHFILHRRLSLRWNDLDTPRRGVHDARHSLYFGKKRLQSDRDWLEWQANYFAAALLVPRRLLIQALEDQQASKGIRRRGRIYVDDQRQNRQDYREILRELRDLFQVSQTLLRYRLLDLGLLTDERSSDLGKHVQVGLLPIRGLYSRDQRDLASVRTAAIN